MLTPDLRIVAASNAYLQATMTRRENILGRHLFEVFPDNPDDKEATGVRNVSGSLERVLATRAPDTMAVQKYDIRRPESEGGGFEERYWSPVNSPVFDGDGSKIAFFIHRVEDVTGFVRLKQQGLEQSRERQALQIRADHMEAEIFLRAREVQDANERLRVANEELTRRNAERAELYQRLHRLDQLKTAFFANVSHELRTPLALILGPVRILLEGADVPAECRESLQVVERNARTLLKHVNDLLDVARLEAGKMAASYADVDLARLVRETAANFDGVAGQRAIQYDVRTPETIRADVDPDKLQRILINLLGNAFKFTPDGGRVRCELFVDEDDGQPWVGLRVSDSGPGVPSPLREAVFERFVQAEDHATRRFGGTGLGLAIVRDFVDLHHGQVTIGDTPGGGATFVVRLPRLAPSGTRVRAADARDVSLHANLIRATLDELSTLDRPPQPVVRPLGAPSPTSVTLLVVEDNPDMNRFVSDALRDRYRVLSAHGAEEALAMAASEKPDLIISDVMMAGMSGEALLQSLRARPEFDSMPVVMLTAKADEESRVRLLNAGAQDYLTKPVLMEELRARVANLVAIKKSRDILQEGFASAEQDLAALARAHVDRERELERARLEAERANRAKDEFLSVVSHELRTPLNVVQGWFWQVKRRGDDPALRSKAIDVIERNLAVQMRLVEDLLDASKAALGKLHMQKRLVDLAAVCRSAVDANQRYAHDKDLMLAFTEPDAPEFVWGDQDRLQQALSNVLENAIKFTPSGGSARVTIERVGLRARLQVQDTGLGIRPEFLPSVFEPFAQADMTSTRRFGGLGLGLAIVKEIVTRHGGTVTATSEEENRGTTVVMEFPVPAVLDDPERRQKPQGMMEPSDHELEGVKVLVVDDEPDACEAVRWILEHHGATVRTAHSGAEALTLLPQLAPDVLLADIAMPETDGYELLRRVRLLPAGRELAAIALTAHVGVRDAALSAGFQQYRSKPISPEELVSLIAKLGGPIKH